MRQSRIRVIGMMSANPPLVPVGRMPIIGTSFLSPDIFLNFEA